MAGFWAWSPPDKPNPRDRRTPQIQVVLNWFEELKQRRAFHEIAEEGCLSAWVLRC